MDALVGEAKTTLLELAGLHELRSLALIGLSKNAGKTTCLNHIVTTWHASQPTRPLALTSIGRDGEAEDILSGRAKPRIYVYAGTILATAEGALQRSDALLEILELSNIRTAFGEVVVCRALSDGYVELAGPASAEEVGQLHELVRTHEPNCLFIIDGALSRRSQAGAHISEAAILAVSANSSLDPAKLAEKTRFSLDILRSPVIEEADREFLTKLIFDAGVRVIAISEGSQPICLQPPTLVGHGKEIAAILNEETRTLFLRGAVTDQVLRELLREEVFRDLCLVTVDGTHFFINPETKRKLDTRKISLAVLEEIDLRLVCLNPTRSDGHSVISELMLEQLRWITDLPVVDLGPALR